MAAIESASTPEAKLEAAQTYLEKYGERQGELTDKAAAAFREGKVHEREVQLSNRFSKSMAKPFENDDAEAYRTAWEALEFERAGNLAQAEERWRTVKNRFAEEGKLPFALIPEPLARARWGWLADSASRTSTMLARNSPSVSRRSRKLRRNDLTFAVDANSPKGLAILR